MKRYRKALCALCIILIAALWGLSAVRTREWAHLETSRMAFPAGTQIEGERYGVICEGPALTLPSGSYTLSWEIETDAENEIRLTTSNMAAITPSSIRLQPGVNAGSVKLHALDEMYNLQILIDYTSGSYIRVNRIDLSGGICTDTVFTVTFILLAVLAYLYAGEKLSAQRRGELLVLAFAVMIASIPNLKENLNYGHDSSFHLDRLLNMINALRSGQFPARLGGYMQNGYGAVTSVFYPELFLYLPAGMMLCGASLTYSMHVFMIAINLATALSMVYSSSRMFKDSHAGVISAVLYTLCAYRLTDLYTRFSIGEVLAMAFVPMFAAALYEVLLGDKKYWKLLALSGMAIYQSHLITAVLCGIAAAAFSLIFAVRVIREGRVWPLAKAALCALMLCLYALVPLLTYMQSGVRTQMMIRYTPYHLLAPAQLLFDAGAVGAAPADATLKAFSLVIGLPLVAGVLSVLYAAATQEKRDRSMNMALMLTALGTALALMTTTLFPWERVWRIAGDIVGYIQFPWRLLALTSVCFAFAAGLGLSRMTGGAKGAAQIAVFALCAMAVLPMLTAEARKAEYLEPGRIPYWDMVYEDYTLTGTDVKLTADREIHVEGEAQVSGYHKAGTQITAHVKAEENARISFPLFAFDGYAAYIGGEKTPVIRGEDNRIVLDIPAGTDAQIDIRFEGRAVWRAAEAVSLLTAAALIFGGLIGRRKKS